MGGRKKSDGERRILPARHRPAPGKTARLAPDQLPGTTPAGVILATQCRVPKSKTAPTRDAAKLVLQRGIEPPTY